MQRLHAFGVLGAVITMTHSSSDMQIHADFKRNVAVNNINCYQLDQQLLLHEVCN